MNLSYLPREIFSFPFSPQHLIHSRCCTDISYTNYSMTRLLKEHGVFPMASATSLSGFKIFHLFLPAWNGKQWAFSWLPTASPLSLFFHSLPESFLLRRFIHSRSNMPQSMQDTRQVETQIGQMSLPWVFHIPLHISFAKRFWSS